MEHPLLSERRILLTATQDINDLIEGLEAALGDNPGLNMILDPIRQDGARIALRLYFIQREIEAHDVD